MRVFVMCVCTPEVPFHPGPAPEPPAIVYDVATEIALSEGTQRSG